MKIITTLCVIAFSQIVFAKKAVIPEIELLLKKNLVLKTAKGTQFSTQSVFANWLNLDPARDKVEGVSADLTYEEYSRPIIDRNIIVAVIDSGVDIHHEDLKGRIWVNKNEIPGNGIDDDNNGFIDDINGWNFIGGKDGRHIDGETLEVTREVRRMKAIAQNRSLSPSEALYLKTISEEVDKGRYEANKGYERFRKNLDEFIAAEKYLKKVVGDFEITLPNLQILNSANPEIVKARDTLISYLDNNMDKSYLKRATDYYYQIANYYYNENFDPRSEIVGDDPNDQYESDYGNNDVIGPDARHGTHVAGIIAAVRDNKKGINGIASKVKIMVLRAVPNGDERDKDIANSIIYAVDNGAKIINMSFGKAYSPYKVVVDEAISYAKSKGVLLVHAAGNDGKNNDFIPSFPNSRDDHWLEVGASSAVRGPDLAADFSNYGVNSVDLFAPGVGILSTTPGNKYDSLSGTSMAAPTVSGVAALVLNYKSNLDGIDLKNLLMETTTQYPTLDVINPGMDTFIPFRDLSVNGGIVNAYSAISTLLR